ncbi:hypothetical protein [Limnobacter litoralis]|uniref:HPt domain-containing protein n=1 Tax=Limnobacter litoralis TaxID=481366 RepID=A0ABQ5YT90_9BURK|nr:hypothetical protein [Limnobacter litoralis]GLR27121.1 hypothetical protein GCM10007875_22120 [Limnobacter litoralis]
MNTVDIDGIDMPEAMARLAGNNRLLVRVVRELIKMFDQQASDLLDCIQSEKFEETYTKAHGFKGIAASIVALPAFEATRVIEEGCEQKSVVQCEAGFKDLSQAIERMRSSLPAES